MEKSNGYTHIFVSALIVNNSGDKIFFVFDPKTETWKLPSTPVACGEYPHEVIFSHIEDSMEMPAFIITAGAELDLDESANQEELPLPVCILKEKASSLKKIEKQEQIHYIYLMQSPLEGITAKSTASSHDFTWLTLNKIGEFEISQAIQKLCYALLQRNEDLEPHICSEEGCCEDDDIEPEEE